MHMLRIVPCDLLLLSGIVILLDSGWTTPLLAQQRPIAKAIEAEQTPDDTPTEVLSAEQQERVDESVERALEWMVTQQQDDGSFLTLQRGQPGVTCLCVMAFMAHGHLP